MRLFLLLFLIVFLTFNRAANMDIRLQKSSNQQAYRIVCVGGVGPYNYQVNGLPTGAYLNNDKIFISNLTKPGNYVLNIVATDSLGQNIEKKVNLGIESIVKYSSSNQANQKSLTQDLPLGSLFSSNKIFNKNTGTQISSNQTINQSNSNFSSSIDNSYLSQIFSRLGIKAPSPQSTDSISNSQFIDPNKYLKDLLEGKNPQSTSQNNPFDPLITSKSQIRVIASNLSSSTIKSSNNLNQVSNTTVIINSNQSIPKTSSSITSTPSIPSTLSRSISNRLDNLISTYSIQPINKPSQSTKQFPKINFPTSQDPKQFNPTPIIISNYDASPGSENRRKISPGDVILRAASDRHQNAIKSISNLIKITDQARANKAQAQNLIDQLNDQYNIAIQNQRKAQQDLGEIQTKLIQGNSSIANINNQLNILQGQIGDAKRQKDSLTSQRVQLQSQLVSLTQKRNFIYDQYNKATATIKGYQTAEKTRKDTCTSLSSQSTNYRTQLNNASTQSINTDNKIFDLMGKLRIKQQLVDNLQKQLTAAIQDKNSIQKDLSFTKAIKDRLPAKIEQLNQNIKRSQLLLFKCQNDVQSLRDTIRQQEEKAHKYKSDVNEIENKLIDYNNKINLLSATISSLDKNGPNQASRITQLQNTLSSLKQQQIKLLTQRNAQYNSGNDANNKVVFAKQNLDTANQRYRNQQSILNSANLNIQKARAEEALARAALQEHMLSRTDVLPFAIVPNGGGNTDAGNPRGNNPSGSPLGPIITTGNGAPGSFVVNSWTNYLSQAFGAGVNPAFSGSVTNIFPFTFSSLVQGNRVINVGNIRSSQTIVPNTSTILYGSNGCGGFGRTRSVTGTISSIKNDSFDIRADNGQSYTVAVSPCTTLVSNRNRYRAKKGDYALIKGVQQSQGRINGQNILCLV